MTVKARPILFSGPMVRALLAGTKTQTRRIVKPQPMHEGVRSYGDSWAWRWNNLEGWFSGVTTKQLVSHAGMLQHCPYGQPGDLLWARETFLSVYKMDWNDMFVVDDTGNYVEELWYRANAGLPDAPEYRYLVDDEHVPTPWKPSIHMPRWASRITLRITEVRVQRLQECSNEDAIAEGIGSPLDARYAAAHEYRALWESINGPESWTANPWVWALTFEVMHANVDRVLEQAAA